MSVIWMTPGPAVSRWDYSELARALGWRDGEPFHPSESELSETAYVAPDGTRVVVYHPRAAVTWGGTRRIAAYGPRPDRTANAIARRIPTSDRTIADVFHRFDVVNTAVCATDDGAWWIQSRPAAIAFQAPGDAAPTTVAQGLHAPVAIAAGDRAVYVTSCNDPRASRLARIDRATRELSWLCELDRPTQLAVLGDVAYVATASGLVAVDRTGAIEPQPLGVPPPQILTASRDALYWIEPNGEHIVEYRAGRGRVIASGSQVRALDVDDDRLYLLEGDNRILAIESDGTRVFELDGLANGRAGILRLGPLLVTLAEWDESYYTRIKHEYVSIGYPRLADAPHELVAQARDDDGARAVLADWLADRGVRASAYALGRVLGDADYGCEDWRGNPDSLPCSLATPLATHDREIGYVASGRHMTVLAVDELL